MHLTVFPGDTPVFLDNHGSVVIQSCGSFLEQGSHDDHPQLFCQFTVERC